MSQTTSPCINRSNRVCWCWFSFLMLTKNNLFISYYIILFIHKIEREKNQIIERTDNVLLQYHVQLLIRLFYHQDRQERKSSNQVNRNLGLQYRIEHHHRSSYKPKWIFPMILDIEPPYHQSDDVHTIYYSFQNRTGIYYFFKKRTCTIIYWFQKNSKI